MIEGMMHEEGIPLKPMRNHKCKFLHLVTGQDPLLVLIFIVLCHFMLQKTIQRSLLVKKKEVPWDAKKNRNRQSLIQVS